MFGANQDDDGSSVASRVSTRVKSLVTCGVCARVTLGLRPGSTGRTRVSPGSYRGDVKVTSKVTRKPHKGYSRVTCGLHYPVVAPHCTRITTRLHHGDTRVAPGLRHGYTRATTVDARAAPRSNPGFSKVTPRLHQGCPKFTPSSHQGHTRVTPKLHRATPG